MLTSIVLRFTDVTALTVQNGNKDVGAIDSAIYDILVKNGKIDEKKLKVIWKSQELFQYPWALEKNVSEEDMKLIQNAMLDIK